jgi:hypothetical protein
MTTCEGNKKKRRVSWTFGQVREDNVGPLIERPPLENILINEQLSPQDKNKIG